MQHRRGGTAAIGILGGMGPAATVDLLQRIIVNTPAQCDQHHIPVVVWSDPSIPDRTLALLNGGESPVSAMRRGLTRLEAVGASTIAIACNTAHHWYGELASTIRVPILHIGDCVVADLSARLQRPRRIGLLCTKGTIVSGFYHDRLRSAGLDVICPTERVQDGEVAAGIAAVKTGDIAAARPLLLAAAKHLRGDGAEILLMGCTEIPVAIRDCLAPETTVDANDVLARACVAHALGQ